MTQHEVVLVRHDTATVSTLGWERENRVLRHWNEACHLRSMDPVL
jgi:probable phosphoglycerate mutase